MLRENGAMARMARFDDLLGSAEGCDDVAAFELAMCYASGAAGAPVDLVQAHRWFNVAAAWGNADALPWRSEIADEMSRVEVAEAQRLARITLAHARRAA
jgi:uncharacterized protein